MKTIKSFSLITVTFLVTALSADAQQLTRDEMDRLSETYLKESIIELRDMLAVPNIGNIPEHVNANIEWMDEAFSRRGFSNSLLETAGPLLMIKDRSECF